uniref:Uncharacterized protein n=1 Tax=Xenopus tropicalis TaxID=8364 RepID=A0A1B8Y1U3_XENTR
MPFPPLAVPFLYRDGLGVLLSETPAAHLEPANLCLTLLPTVWMVSRGIRQEDWCDVLKAFQLTGKFRETSGSFLCWFQVPASALFCEKEEISRRRVRLEGVLWPLLQPPPHIHPDNLGKKTRKIQ